jgi:hypothetical protein
MNPDRIKIVEGRLIAIKIRMMEIGLSISLRFFMSIKSGIIAALRGSIIPDRKSI